MKVVVKLAVHDEKEKQKAMQAVSGISGIESFSLDMNDQKLIITGDIDPIDVVSKLRKYWYAEIVSFGPLEKKIEESKTNEPKEDMKNDDNDKKKTEDVKVDDTNKKEAEDIEDLIIASNNYYPYHPRNQPYYYYVPHQPENPNTCVIC